MADKSPIEWTDATWNPIVGCSILSPGCTHCYAMKMAGRIEAMAKGGERSEQGSKSPGAKHYAGTTKKVNGNTVWTGKVALAPDHILLQPLAWRTPRRIFVNSMGDLFHEDVPDEWIDKVFAVMALAPQHTFQVLTKRAKRMQEYFAKVRDEGGICDSMSIVWELSLEIAAERALLDRYEPRLRVLPNVWLGVSAERQQEADERIPDLLATPAAIRFVSAEPLLGPIDFTRIPLDGFGAGPGDKRNIGDLTVEDWDRTVAGDPAIIPCASALGGSVEKHIGKAFLDWIIVGGESGPDARGMHPAWARSIRDQCEAAGAPFFFKQWGAWAPICAMADGQSDRYFAPAPESDPDAIRRCRVSQCILNADGERFDLDEWSRGSAASITRTYRAGQDSMLMFKVGKKAAGRLLDGIEHHGMPELREVSAL